MTRRALLVGINDYRSIGDLNGCINDVKNMRYVLKTLLGFENDDIRVLVDTRATKANIMERLKWMVDSAKAGDFLVFHFSGHGSQIRDRNNDELEDNLDELLCPYDMDWDNCFILDDDLAEIFSGLPENVLLEVTLDCCHSGTATRNPFKFNTDQPRKYRYLPPPEDIVCRYEGEEHLLKPTKGFRSAGRSTMNHILWAACESFQESADATINGTYNGAFTYYFCKHMRDTEGRVTRRLLLERIRNSLKYEHFAQTPLVECRDEVTMDNYVFQYSPLQNSERVLYLKTPYMRGEDVRKVQAALERAGFSVIPDGVFGPHTRQVVIEFQRRHNLPTDGVVGPKIRSVMFP